LSLKILKLGKIVETHLNAFVLIIVYIGSVVY